jgi:hypothetical protein
VPDPKHNSRSRINELIAGDPHPPALDEGQPGAAHPLGLSDEEFVRLEDPDPTLTKRHRLYITLWALPSAHMAADTREVI